VAHYFNTFAITGSDILYMLSKSWINPRNLCICQLTK